jgi:hypothetical protein
MRIRDPGWKKIESGIQYGKNSLPRRTFSYQFLALSVHQLTVVRGGMLV